MSGTRPSEYAATAAATLRDKPEVRASITAATRTFDGHRAGAYAQIDADRWRTWMEGVKNHVLTHLGDYLEQAEESLTRNGVRGHWAETADDALAALAGVVESNAIQRHCPREGKQLAGQRFEVRSADLVEPTAPITQQKDTLARVVLRAQKAVLTISSLDGAEETAFVTKSLLYPGML